MTLKDIETMDREMLTPSIVAAVIGCNPQLLRIQARECPQALGFPTVIVGKRVKIPRAGFIAYCQGLLGTRSATG